MMSKIVTPQLIREWVTDNDVPSFLISDEHTDKGKRVRESWVGKGVLGYMLSYFSPQVYTVCYFFHVTSSG